MNRQPVKSCDVVRLFAENIGYLAVPSRAEPIPEEDENLTHLRVVNNQNTVKELWERGLFKVVLYKRQEKNNYLAEDLRYGNIIQLRNLSNDFLVSATSTVHYPIVALDNDITCLHIGKYPWHGDELTSRWQICSRFKVRQDGDLVLSDDFILLKNIRYRDKVLAIYDSNFKCTGTGDALAVCRSLSQLNDLHYYAWNITTIQRHDSYLEDKDIKRSIKYGDYIRLNNIEQPNNILISRVNDDVELQSTVAPLGLSCLKFIDQLVKDIDIYVKHDSDKSIDNSMDSIWQILPTNDPNCPITDVIVNSIISFRHLQLNKFLSFENNNNKITCEMIDDINENCYFYLRHVDNDGINEHDNKVIYPSDSLYVQHYITNSLLSLYVNSTNNVSSSQCNWWEYRLDKKLEPLSYISDSKSLILTSACSIQLVDFDVIKETKLMNGFLPVMISSLHALHTSKLDATNFPLFRHLCNSLVSLLDYILYEREESYIVNMLPSKSNETNIIIGKENDSNITEGGISQTRSDTFKLSSISWITDNYDRNMETNFDSVELYYDAIAYRNKIDFKQFSNDKPQIIQRRKGLFINSKFLDIAILFVQTIHNIFRSKLTDDEINHICSRADIPNIIINSCIVIQDIISLIVVNNPLYCIRLIGMSQLLIEMIYQKILGKWNPPLFSIFTAVEQINGIKKYKDLQYIIDNAITIDDIKMIVDLMHTYRLHDDNRAIQILDILSLLAYPGNIANKRFQEYILGCVSPNLYISNDISFNRKFKDMNYYCPSNKLIHTKLDGNVWTISSLPITNISENSQEVSNEITTDITRTNELELLSIYNLFYNTTVNSISLISNSQPSNSFTTSSAFHLLASLGFGLDILENELNYLKNCNFWEFYKWLYGRRLLYLPITIDQPTIQQTSLLLKIPKPTENNNRISIFNQLSSSLFNMGSKRKLSAYAVPSDVKINQQKLYLPWTDILKSDYLNPELCSDFDKVWIRASLELIISLSKGRNIHSQRFGSIILPCECLLGIISDIANEQSNTINITTKTLLCKYLFTIYVDNDFVYNGTFSINNDILYYGFNNTTDNNNTVSKFDFSNGSLFNSSSRYIFKECNSEILLRYSLFLFIKYDISMIKLLDFSTVDSDNDTNHYNFEFLNLLHSLIKINFFDGHDDINISEFINSYKYNILIDNNIIVDVEVDNECLLIPKFTTPLDVKFNISRIELIILDKLTAFNNSLRNINIKHFQNQNVNTVLRQPSCSNLIMQNNINYLNTSGDLEYNYHDNLEFQNIANMKLDSIYNNNNIVRIVTSVVLILSSLYNLRISNYIFMYISTIISTNDGFKNDKIEISNKNLTDYINNNELIKNSLIEKIYNGIINCFYCNLDDRLYRAIITYIDKLSNYEIDRIKNIKDIICKVRLACNHNNSSLYLHVDYTIKLLTKYLNIYLISVVKDSIVDAMSISCRINLLNHIIGQFIRMLLFNELVFEKSLKNSGLKSRASIAENISNKLFRHSYQLIHSEIEMSEINDDMKLSDVMEIDDLNKYIDYSQDYERRYGKINYPIKLSKEILDQVYGNIKHVLSAITTAINALRQNQTITNTVEAVITQKDTTNNYSSAKKNSKLDSTNDFKMTDDDDSIIAESVVDLIIPTQPVNDEVIDSVINKGEKLDLFVERHLDIIGSLLELITVLSCYSTSIANDYFKLVESIVLQLLSYDYSSNIHKVNKYKCLNKILNYLYIICPYIHINEDIELRLVDYFNHILEKMNFIKDINLEIGNPNKKLTRKLYLSINIIKLISRLLTNESFKYSQIVSISSYQIGHITNEIIPNILNSITNTHLSESNTSDNNITETVQNNTKIDITVDVYKLFNELMNLIIQMSVCKHPEINGFNFPMQQLFSLTTTSSIISSQTNNKNTNHIIYNSGFYVICTMLFNTTTLNTENLILKDLKEVNEYLLNYKTKMIKVANSSGDDSNNNITELKSYMKSHCYHFTCREFIVTGALRSLIWRMLTSSGYDKSAVYNKYVSSLLKISKISKFPKVVTNAPNDIINNWLYEFLSRKLDEIWSHNSQDYNNDNKNQYPSYEWFQSVYLLITIYLEYSNQLYLRANENYVIYDLHYILIDLSHLITTTSYFLNVMVNNNENSSFILNNMTSNQLKVLKEQFLNLNISSLYVNTYESIYNLVVNESNNNIINFKLFATSNSSNKIDDKYIPLNYLSVQKNLFQSYLHKHFLNELQSLSSINDSFDFEIYSSTKVRTSFNEWSENGLKLFINIIKYIHKNILKSNQQIIKFLCLFNNLLYDNIDRIKVIYNSNFNQMKTLIDLEIKRVYGLQNVLTKCSIIQLAIKGLYAYDSSLTNDSFLNSINKNSSTGINDTRCLSFQLCSSLMAWGNRNTQEAIIDNLTTTIETLPISGISNISKLIKFHQNRLESAIDFPDNLIFQNLNENDLLFYRQFLSSIVELEYIYQFSGRLCYGYYQKGNLFLSGQVVKTNVNILKDIIESMMSLSAIAFQLINYIDYEPFTTKLAPKVLDSTSNSSNKRQFINWFHKNNNFPLLQKIIKTLSVGFDSLVRIYDTNTFDDMAMILSICPKLLEFTGLMHLKSKTAVSNYYQQTNKLFHFINKIIPNSIPKVHIIKWYGGNPVKFYQLYKKELNSMNNFGTDPLYDNISNYLKNIKNGVNDGNNLQVTLLNSESNSNSEVETWGIKLSDLFQYTDRCELNCLRFITSMLENSFFQPATLLIRETFDYSILTHNLLSYYKVSIKSINNDIAQQITVLYFNLLTSMSIQSSEIREMFSNYVLNTSLNSDKGSIVGSIEILDNNSNLQTIYYAIPTFITKYWIYPEVQKIKENIVLTIDRSSPEDKISDFYVQMNKVVLVMQRQKRLKRLLGPVVHQFVGGLNVLNRFYLFGFFPNQQVIFLLLTIFFNIYFAYTNSISKKEILPNGSNKDYHTIKYGIDLYAVNVLQLLYICLAGLICLRHFLNSRACDDINIPTVTSNSFPILFHLLLYLMNFVVYVIKCFIAIMIDAYWCLLLLGFTLLGYFVSVYFYALCLIDIINIFELLNFLVIAISRNIIRIGFTVLMALILLYFYAIADYKFFPDQYELNGHYGCSNIVSCFKLHIDYGLNSSPNWIGNSFISTSISYFGGSQYAVLGSRVIGTLYTLSFIIIINLVLPAIISGLIIDTFSTMRQESEDVNTDITTICFICSLSKDDFEKEGINFSHHVREEHNMWKYLWFKLYLEFKDPLNYSKSEYYVSDLLKTSEGFLRLVPLKRSASLERAIQSKNKA